MRSAVPSNVTIEFVIFVTDVTATASPIPFNAEDLVANDFPDRLFCNTLLMSPPEITKFVKSAPLKNVKAKKLDKFQQIPLTWLQVFKLFHKSHTNFPRGLIINLGSGVGVC